MSQEIRVAPATDAERYLATDRIVWPEEELPRDIEAQLEGLRPEHRFAADRPGSDPRTYAGIYGVLPMELAVPSRDAGSQPVPIAGLTWVGVHPDHRRRGVLTAMLRDHFARVHDQAGVAISALHASEPAIYGRHGYGLASLGLGVKLGRGTKLVAPHLDEAAETVRTELATITDPGLPSRIRAITAAAARTTHGPVIGEDDYFRRVCRQWPERLRDKEPIRVLFAHQDGEDIGYVGFRRTLNWDHGRPDGELTVEWLVGTPPARLALLRRVVDFDLMGSVTLGGVGAGDELLQWIGGPRGAQDVITYENLWVRLVDLPEALEARTYDARCDVVVEVTDAAAPWNEGTWRIVVDDSGKASVERSTAEAGLRLPAQALGAAYLGDSNLITMGNAGLVQEARPGAVRELWRAMRTETRPAPAMGF